MNKFSFSLTILLVIFSGRAFAQGEKNSVANDPTIVKALALLPKEYAVPQEIVFLMQVHNLPPSVQEYINRRPAFYFTGKSWIGITSEDNLYVSAKNSNNSKSSELYVLASAIYHEYYHMQNKHKGARETKGMSIKERKVANEEELVTLMRQKVLLLHFLLENKELRKNYFFSRYCELIDLAIQDRQHRQLDEGPLFPK